MINILHGIFFILFTYFFSGTVLFLLALVLISKHSYNKYYRVIYILFLGMGPVVISWILEKLMYIFVGYSVTFYASFILILFLSVFISVIAKNKEVYGEWIVVMKTISKLDIISSIILLIFLLPIVLLPVIGNDASQYFYVARVIYVEKSFHYYPLIKSFLYKGYFPWTHPSGYVGLLTWGYFFSKGIVQLYLLKSVTVFYVFLQFLLMSELSKKYGECYAKVGSLLIFMAPQYCLMMIQFHIDIFRVFLFFSPLVYLKIILETKDSSAAMLLGVSLALSAHAHSIGILAIVFCVAIVVCFAGYMITVKNMMVVMLSIICILCFRYWCNFLTFGYVISDNPLVWNLDFIKHNEYVASYNHLLSWQDKFINGILKGFTYWDGFGLTYWYMAFISIVTVIVDKIRMNKFVCTFSNLILNDKLFPISIAVIFLWYSFTILSTILGGYSFIKNSRYLLTVYPFIIYVSLVLSINFIKNNR